MLTDLLKSLFIKITNLFKQEAVKVKRHNGKSSVKVFGVCPEMFFAYQVAYQVYREMGNASNCVLTSARDGTHKRGSDHYMGDAIDIRVWGFSDDERARVRDMIEERLTDEFEVFDEGDHIHIGFDIQTISDNEQ